MTDRWGFLGTERVFRGPWSAFERAVARLLVHKGWPHVVVIGGSGDNGGDIIAASASNEVVYQVKYRSNGGAVGREIVDDIKRAMEFYNIPRGCVVTNGYLSKAALDYLGNLTRSGYVIATIEGRDLLEQYRQLPYSPNQKNDVREYQALALTAIWSAFERGNRTALLVLATGLGKTFVAGRFLAGYYDKYSSARVLILANKDDLIKQFDIALWGHLPKSVATHLWDEREKPMFGEGVTLATFQSVFNHVRAGKAVPEYNVVLIDECHHAGADTYRHVIESLNPDFLLGMTATPFRTDDRDITDIFGFPVFSMDIIRGMRHGFLAKVDYRVFSDDIDWDFVHLNSEKSLSVKNLNKQLFIPKRDQEIVAIIRSVWEVERVNRAIIFCASIEHCKQIESELLSYGFKARALYAGLDPRLRERHLRDFRRGRVNVLASVDILNEGIDVPEVDLVVFLRVTHSRIIFLQQLGRGLRINGSKTKVTVLDFVTDIKRVASLLNLRNEDKNYVDSDIEIFDPHRFFVKFNDSTSESLFEAIIRDRFDIEDFDDAKELFIPPVTGD